MRLQEWEQGWLRLLVGVVVPNIWRAPDIWGSAGILSGKEVPLSRHFMTWDRIILNVNKQGKSSIELSLQHWEGRKEEQMSAFNKTCCLKSISY